MEVGVVGTRERQLAAMLVGLLILIVVAVVRAGGATPAAAFIIAVGLALFLAYAAYSAVKEGELAQMAERVMSGGFQGEPALIEYFDEWDRKHPRRWLNVIRGGGREGGYLYVFGGGWCYGVFSGYAGRGNQAVAVVDPAAACAPSGSISIQTPDGDYAAASVKPAGPGLAEVSITAHLVKARSAKLELVIETPRGRRPVPLGEAATTYRGRVDFRGVDRPIALVFGGVGGLEKYFKTPAAGLAPYAKYALRLTLDVPLAPDVQTETPVEVQCPKPHTSLRLGTTPT
ncbi:hypothetical protein [Pyrobaculum neutrophilum]|uniref:Uncharacterized protein n=1 Tax=Pyrobaculum neutrophilum (strain DSM 2338 / JCM 9278 / NBRC 100436 / V24Sta) TaxID=444157 RepID=B1YBA9_PYRNV|nr:hypothetical protein [Pyrobaculum neutrophilum]ACB39240.1 conserved hypothetical protein [Pyrobaculum neutrophilum V24Sta]